MRKVLFAGTALLVLALAVGAIAQGPPELPPGHVPVPPGADAATCYQCHQSPPPLDPNVSSFCTYCHDFAYSHRTAPLPKHPVDFNWPAKDCGTCHRLHAGPNPTHQASAEMPNSSFCVACHLPPGAYSGEDYTVGDFCGKCHHLGIQAEGHPSGEGKTAEFCYSCHTVGE